MKILITLLLFISLSSNAQWIPLGLETQSSFRAIKAYKNHIWIGGTIGTVIHSADQGKTWSIQQVAGADKLDFRDLAILNDQEVILMSAGLSQEKAAKLYKTTNGGQTWEILYETNEPGYFFDAITWNAKTLDGLIVSDPKDGKFSFFKLTDKGKKIEKQTAIKSPSLLTPREAAFAASGSSLISTPSNDFFLVTGGSQKARIYQSKDKGKNWITRAEVCCTDSSSGFFSIAAKNKQHLMAAGGNYLRIHENTLPMMESIDGGKKWSPLANSPDFYIEKIIYSKPYWIVTGPSRSAAYHEELKEWRKLPESHFHNIIQIKNMLIGVGGKGQLGKLPIAQIDALFLSKK